MGSLSRSDNPPPAQVSVSEVDGEFEHPVYLGDERLVLQEIKCQSKLGSRKTGGGGLTAKAKAAAAATTNKDEGPESEDERPEAHATRKGAVVGVNAEALSKTPINWVAVDPSHEWLCAVRVHQTEAMLCCALAEARDVSVQAEAVAALASARPLTESAVQALGDCVRSSTTFCRVRVEAAAALGRLAGVSDVSGKRHLQPSPFPSSMRLRDGKSRQRLRRARRDGWGEGREKIAGAVNECFGCGGKPPFSSAVAPA